MKAPVFTHGTYENTIKAIQEGKIKYPAYCWITDKEQYGFLNKNNELETIGIPLLTGTIEKQIILSELDDGLYEIKGQYKITSESETIFFSFAPISCIVQTIDEVKKIKHITSNEIVDYTIINEEISSDTYITESYLRDHGYVTEDYVNLRIEALKREIEDEIGTLIEPVIRPMVEEVIDEDIQNVSDEEIESLFPNE